MVEVGQEKEEAYIGWVGKGVVDEVAGFSGNAVAELDEAGPRAEVGTDDVLDGVTDVGTKGGLVGLEATKEVVA